MFIYRPNRYWLDEAMAEKKEFSSIEEMVNYLVTDHPNAFDVEDVYVSYYGYDDRISWETYIVLTNRYRDNNAVHPIGYCTGTTPQDIEELKKLSQN